MCVMEETLVIAESIKSRGYPLFSSIFLFVEFLASFFKCVVIRADPSDTETLAVGDTSGTMMGMAGCINGKYICTSVSLM